MSVIQISGKYFKLQIQDGFQKICLDINRFFFCFRLY